ncbi:hypothetical protein BJ138DRAFT_1146041, partial [Hygrophoropsis aurantiaca]
MLNENTMLSLSKNSRQPIRESWSRERLEHERAIALAFADSYSSSLDTYLRFCALHHIDPEPTPDTLSHFAASLLPLIGQKYLKSDISDIVSDLKPFYPQLRTIRSSVIVKRTLSGSRHRLRGLIKRKVPLMKPDILRVTQELPRPWSFDDTLFIVLLQIGFFGLLRIGDLVRPDDPARQSFRIPFRLTASVNSEALQFRIRHTITEGSNEGDLIQVRRNLLDSDLDPLDLFRAYLQARDNRFPIHPYLWIRFDGTIPDRAWFMQRLRGFFEASVGGYSLRAGGATSLAVAGMSIAEIQELGRWSPDTWERYILKNPGLLQTVLFPEQSMYPTPFPQA